SNGDTQYDTLVEVTSVEVNPQLPEAFFNIPKVEIDDFVIADGATSITLPFELLNNHIYVEAMVNDGKHGRFLVDTGGVNLLTASAATTFGIESQGAIQGRGVGEETVDVSVAQIESFTFGGITLSDQTFFVIPLAEVQAAEGVAFDGLIGFEVFKRFIVEIDYVSGQLTLTRPEAFEYSGKGVSIPFKFDNRTPIVEGTVASVPATFSIDTGSRSTLDLFPQFVATHDLEKTLRPRFEALSGWGVGGGVRSKLAAGATLRLGEVEIPDVVTAFSQQQEGAFADTYLAGNIGGGVLKRFTVTFDYGNKVMILEPNSQFDNPEPYDRSGMWLNAQDDVFKVFDVTAGGAADAAGVHVGDLVIAVNGTESNKLTLPALRESFRLEPPGTTFTLTLVSDDGQREAQLGLKNLLAE
ncbi:MAG: PDZ domain-containing protein, partial [bacterium]|nr:PDZ domain-containing protein [bacterium]